MGKFDGRFAFITGGGRGQGRSHAVSMAQEGAHIAIFDVCASLPTVPYSLSSIDDMETTKKLVEEAGCRCLTFEGDVSNAAAVQDAVDSTIGEFGAIDIALANAGILTFGLVHSLSVETWQQVIDTNLTGVFNTLRAVVPGMIERGKGRIVATSSMAGRQAFPNAGHYVASKYGVIGLVKSAAIELAPYGITANAVCPTNCDTEMIHNEALYRVFCPEIDNPTTADIDPIFSGMNPMGIPHVQPHDISSAIMFLASDEARFITGEVLTVSGGMIATNVA